MEKNNVCFPSENHNKRFFQKELVNGKKTDILLYMVFPLKIIGHLLKSSDLQLQ